jgi:hypothetical protein
MPGVPRDWAGLTPEWLGEALGRPVSGVSVSDVAEGTNARARVEVRLRRSDAPMHLFVKREGRLVNRLALTALGARDAEADLARSGLDLPLEHPAYYAGAVDRRRLAAIVVMEDVTARGAHPNDPREPLSVDHVAAGLRELAALHVAYANRPLPQFVRPWRLGRQWAPVAWAGLVHARRKLRRLGVGFDVDVGQLERDFRGWAAIARMGPQTLLHGDPHPGNTYTLGERIGFYDWQLVRLGSWVHDVGYFVASSLSIADRRAHERDLLASYLKCVSSAGGGPEELTDAWSRYQRTPAYGLGAWLQTIAAGTFQPLDVCLRTIERFLAAYRELTQQGAVTRGAGGGRR